MFSTPIARDKQSETMKTAIQFHHTLWCLPQNCIFRNKNQQNPEHSIIFRNTSANASPNLWNTSGYQILWENHRVIYTVHLPYWFHAAKKLFADHIRLSASPIISQQYCELQSSCKCQLSHLWWPKATSHGMLSQTFGNVSFSLMTVLQVTINRLGHVLPRTRNVFYKRRPDSWLREEICMFLLSRMRNASKSGFGKFRYKIFSDSQEKNRKSWVCCSFQKWQNLELWEAIRISGTPCWFFFIIFRNEYDRAVTAGMYAHWLMIKYYQTRFDNKRISSSEDIVEIVIFCLFKPWPSLWSWHWTW